MRDSAHAPASPRASGSTASMLPARRAAASLIVAFGLLFLLSFSSFAQAKEVVDYFGTPSGFGGAGGEFRFPSAIAVNQTGAGPADRGEIYVADPGGTGFGDPHNRIERFSRDDNGTPADPYDDTYAFVSAWGAGVDSALGGTDYQVCTLAASCQPAVASAGNGTAAGNGVLDLPGEGDGIAVDSDTGDVYVSDRGNNRVNVYAGDGTFLRSFGFDVDATTPATGYEVCPATDVCKAGLSGSGLGQIDAATGIVVSQPDDDPASGTVFLADSANHRIDTYHLDGTSPATIGSAATFGSIFGNLPEPRRIAVDSRGILYASNSTNHSEIERYDTQGLNGLVGFLAPIPATGVSEVQELTVAATAGSYRLSFGGYTTADIPFNWPANENGSNQTPAIDTVQEALDALPSVAGGLTVRGGPGDATGSNPYRIEFFGGHGATDLPQITVSPGSTPLSGGSGPSIATSTQGQPGLSDDTNTYTSDLAVDPATNALYVLRAGAIQQFGPLNDPGLSAPPTAYDAMHATAPGLGTGLNGGIALDTADGRLYATGEGVFGFPKAHGVYVLDAAGAAPTASLDSLAATTATSCTFHATIDPHGPPPLSYHLEYSTDGTAWTSGPSVLLGTQDTPQSLELLLDPPGGGLDPATAYQVRLSAAKKFAPPVLSTPLACTTDPSPPQVETVGSPVRTATTAVLEGRVNPRDTATTYRFQYVTDAAFQATAFDDLSSGGETEPLPAAADNLIHLASASLGGLQPHTTYRYRIVADNGNSGSPAFGQPFSLTTREAAETLSHGRFSGPPGSDRAWEQVSIPDSGGNPVTTTTALAASGDAAIYAVAGGTPISTDGSVFNQLLSRRVETAPHQGSWQPSLVVPDLPNVTDRQWDFLPSADFSQVIGYNHDPEHRALWRIPLDGPPSQLIDGGPQGSNVPPTGGYEVSADGSRILDVPDTPGSYDPAYPSQTAEQLYDVSTPGHPHLISLLPGGGVPACGVSGLSAAYRDPSGEVHWLSADGTIAFFPSAGDGSCDDPQLYLRQLDAGVTKLISGPPLSGLSCPASFIRSDPQAAFFWTQARLDPVDTKPTACGVPQADAVDGDVYRYDLSSGALKCLTCVVPGLDADVYAGASSFPPAPALNQIGVSADGSHLYFISLHRLLSGAPTGAIYRLDVASGDLAYVAPASGLVGPGGGGDPGLTVGDAARVAYSALSADGSVLLFRSADPALNPLGGTSDNAATNQFYRYDDSDRSLLCVSCPPDGSPPRAPVSDAKGGLDHSASLTTGSFGADALSADGSTLAFYSPTSLVNADQNTAAPGQDPRVGGDLYEWRDGRPLLITDGLSGSADPVLSGVDPSGRDVFFTAFAQLTSDAIDGYRRLYDARIGGGFEFPPPKPPCPLEVCQGTPDGAPEEPPPGTSDFRGPGNPPREGAKCPKRKSKSKGKCVPRHHKAKKRHKRHHRAAHHDRRGGTK